jgi:hypothetical protein
MHKTVSLSKEDAYLISLMHNVPYRQLHKSFWVSFKDSHDVLIYKITEHL